MTREETAFYSILAEIATELKKISGSLAVISNSKKMETEQFLKESKMRINDKRRESRLLNENRHDDNKKAEEFIREVMKR